MFRCYPFLRALRSCCSTQFSTKVRHYCVMNLSSENSAACCCTSGQECSNSIFYFGQTPNQQIEPALSWALAPGSIGRRDDGMYRDIYLVGSDYVFPRTANAIVKGYVNAT